MNNKFVGYARRIAIFGGLFFALISSAIAQTVATIGLGDVRFDPALEVDARSKSNVISAVTERINQSLNKTRKFNVLPYSAVSEKLKEQGLSLAGFYQKEYAGSSFYQAGLDYILTVDVTEFGLFKKSPDDPENAIGLIDLDFTLYAVADQSVDFTSSVSAQVTKRSASASDNSADQILDQSIQKGVDALVSKMVATVFPLSVVKVDEAGNITLNYGDGLLAQGDTILVYDSGKAVPMAAINNDDDSSGGPIATLQVVSTDLRFSVAQALSGFDELVRGQKGKLLAAEN